MADSATGCESHENLRCGFSAIPCIEDDVFLVDDAAFIGRHIAAIESGGNLVIENLIRCRIRSMISEKVSCKLQDCELIKRHIAVKCIDHPLSIGPHFTIVVKVNAVGVSISGVIKPMAAAMFTPFKFCEKCIDEAFICIGMRIKNKRLNNCGFWWQPGEVIGKPTSECPTVSFFSWHKSFCFKL